MKDLLRKKHAKLLALGWPEGDDLELGPGLRQFRAKRGLNLAQVLSRLAYPYRADWERDPEKVRQVTSWANMSH